MSLGNSNENNKKKNYSPTVYSQYRMSNPESTVDPTSLGFSYWNNFLVISISPKKENSNADYPEWDNDNAVKIFLNHTKARILLQEINAFINGVENKNFGVDSGSGLISICHGSEFGVDNPCLCIRRINPNSGNVESSAVYEFKDTFYSIRDYNERNNNFTKINYDTSLEISELKTVLEQYYLNVTGSIAYNVVDNLKYDNSRTQTKLELIMDKLGIETLKGSYGKSSASIFANSNGNNNNSYSNSSVNDIESMMIDD